VTTAYTFTSFDTDEAQCLNVLGQRISDNFLEIIERTLANILEETKYQRCH